MEPPRSALPLTVLKKSSRHCAPQRMNALNTTAAFWYKGVRNIAGTVRRICREMTPAWRAWLTWLTPGRDKKARYLSVRFQHPPRLEPDLRLSPHPAQHLEIVLGLCSVTITEQAVKVPELVQGPCRLCDEVSFAFH